MGAWWGLRMASGRGLNEIVQAQLGALNFFVWAVADSMSSTQLPVPVRTPVSFGLSAQVVPKSRILARKRATLGNQSILTRRNDKVSYLLDTKYRLNYESVGTNPAFC